MAAGGFFTWLDAEGRLGDVGVSAAWGYGLLETSLFAMMCVASSFYGSLMRKISWAPGKWREVALLPMLGNSQQIKTRVFQALLLPQMALLLVVLACAITGSLMYGKGAADISLLVMVAISEAIWMLGISIRALVGKSLPSILDMAWGACAIYLWISSQVVLTNTLLSSNRYFRNAPEDWGLMNSYPMVTSGWALLTLVTAVFAFVGWRKYWTQPHAFLQHSA